MFANKTAFMQFGLEQVAPSHAHMSQDCYICKDPLSVNSHTTASPRHHQAVRISICGHMHGEECLAAWLDAGNSCPTCKRILFEMSCRSISQTDIINVAHTLGHQVGKARAMSAIGRLKKKLEVERAQLRRTTEEHMKEMKAKEARSGQDDLMNDNEWIEGGDEDFDMEDGDSGAAIN